jgi:Glycosyl transferase family 2
MTATASDAQMTRSVTAPTSRGVAAHWLFGLLFAVGVVLRIVTFRAYQPALLYIDSLSYLANTDVLDPTGARPIGYSLFLRPFVALGDLRLIPVVQHLFGLGLAVGIYVLLLRAGARRWVAALATAPVLLDAYQLQIEQNVLSETLFDVMMFVGLVLVVDGAGRRRLFGRRLVMAVAAGLVLGLLVSVRLIGQFLAVPAVAYLLLTGGRQLWHRLAAAMAFVLAFALPVATSLAYYEAWSGEWSMTSIGGRMIYGRVAVFVDCDRIEIPEDQRDLCPVEPLGQRLKIDNYVWNTESPLNRHTPPPGMTHDESLRSFAMTVIRQQPLDFLRVVLVDMGKNFWPTKAQFEGDVDVGRWQFQPVYPRFGNYLEALALYDAAPDVDQPLADWLRGYQLSVGYTPGALLGVALLIGLLAGLGVGRARHSPLRGACLYWSVSGATIMLLPAAYEFSWRYMLPGLVTLPVAGGLGLTALMERIPAMTATTERPLPATGDADVDDAAVARFAAEYGSPYSLGPIAVVIAAYNEQEALGDVLAAIPSTVEARPVSVVVVDDGSVDATADLAREYGVHVVAPGHNRGQGAALRLGYRIAREGGAEYIATLDADGQYDPAELRTVLLPVLRGEADFVTGSRRLGREETTDNLRRAGVRFYAWLVSALTRQRITDTSFGLRAMRAGVTATVTLTQPQYQSSELLIGALAHGYRVVEVPTTMRERAAGHSKKGHNLLYGFRYGRVVLGTWIRERARRRAGVRRQPLVAEHGTPGGPGARTSPGTIRR